MDKWRAVGLTEKEAMIAESILAATADELKRRDGRLDWLEAQIPPGSGTRTLHFLAMNKDGSVGPDYVDAVTQAEVHELREEIATLKATLAAVERQKGASFADAFMGGFVNGKLYQRGHIVQRNRRTYLALVETREVPGSSSDWRELECGQERAR